ncbi:NosD domain-containing protein [Methanococcoides burtonii]|uniref:Cell surface glycoprotein n=1 Tax=Methanococcoides burtonii (strain DSM 6242 / NBRC 107633 / OCM 468 / ACE-M) TaxID=259564 RepID=Q12YZ7_METBU|nr:NosD domain-containing protein [Methanococcoides burtonii]ABE51329.1 Cell surface glycoprotein [Methanococcoides burtonii DSM 6242]
MSINYKTNGIIKIILLPLFMAILMTQASASILEVGEGQEYSHIQDAVNNANEGDKVIVHSGIYEENVILDKQIILQGVGSPIIDGMGVGNSLSLYAESLVVDGFVLCNGRSGSYVVSDNNILTNNTFKGNQYGVYLFGSKGNVIEQNVIEHNQRYGVYLLFKSDNNIITDNMINNNGGGIRIISSDDNKLYLNSIIENVVISNGNNQWDDGVDKGNHYSFFDEESEGFIDKDHDDVSDVPYKIPVKNEVDNYPLASIGSTRPTIVLVKENPIEPSKETSEEIPEFPTVAFPILLLMGIFVVFNKKTNS